MKSKVTMELERYLKISKKKKALKNKLRTLKLQIRQCATSDYDADSNIIYLDIQKVINLFLENENFDLNHNSIDEIEWQITNMPTNVVMTKDETVFYK